jgi:hypothetical protein
LQQTHERGITLARETAGEKQLREALLELSDIVKATQASEGSYLFTDFLIHSPLINEGLVEINEEITNENGEVATRATQKGIEKVMSENVVEKVVGEKQSFEIVAIPLPTRVRAGGTRKSQYPFEDLEVGHSFFVIPSEKHPDPAKSLASTVSAAMKRYDVPDIDEETGIQKLKSTRNPKTGEIKENVPCMKHTRKFSIVACDGAAYGKPGIVGAAIGRTA